MIWMKLMTFEYQNESFYGVKDRDQEFVWILPRIFEDFGYEIYPRSVLEVIEQFEREEFEQFIEPIIRQADQSDNAINYRAPLYSIDFKAPITPRDNIIGFGKNYAEHIKEMENNPELYIFTKMVSALVGHEDIIPNHQDITNQLDYEGELGVVISHRAYKVKAEEAMDYIYGFTVINDISDRKAQQEHSQSFLAKSLKGSAPMGPWVITKDKVKNPQNLSIVTKVNDEVRQNGNTKDMILDINEQIEIISKYVELQPGDVIATGTPSGVAAGMDRPKFLQPGDTVSITIDEVGTLTNELKR